MKKNEVAKIAEILDALDLESQGFDNEGEIRTYTARIRSILLRG